ncbi:MAG: tetratricopeptide repeat protein [Cardiobacteriaceae bacterium]|nr:tetratricopeptide repeat protein [Cardiobacteriaceae bacterium]
MTPELDSTLHARISRFCELGDNFVERNDYGQALELYQYAWNLLPEPKNQWQAATWILTAMGDSHFLRGNCKAARSKLEEALHCPDGCDNPFIRLRLGQALLELGEAEKAAIMLGQAHELGGAEIFAGEDPKYLQHIEKS